MALTHDTCIGVVSIVDEEGVVWTRIWCTQLHCQAMCCTHTFTSASLGVFELNCAIELVHQEAAKELPMSAKHAEQALQRAWQSTRALQLGASSKEQAAALNMQAEDIREAAQYLAKTMNRGFSYELYTYAQETNRAVGITFGLAAIDGDPKSKGTTSQQLL